MTFSSRFSLVAVLPLMLFSSNIASASEIRTGNDYYENCRSLATRQDANDSNIYNQAVCQGYTLGVWDSLGLFEKDTICVPLNVTLGQVVDISYDWLKRHPERRQNHAMTAIANALANAFPCK